ncbi:MAG: hypothetical protein PHU34_11350 [Candidatus Methanoperedens sp.]|nr:hypothetical protein [Candidatus Methanoperedens sp.]
MATRSDLEIEKWQKLYESYHAKGQDEAYNQRLGSYRASIAIGRDFNESVEAYLNRKDLKRFWDWTPTLVKIPETKIDTSSKDYKAGYNLAIQGRIAPAVPAWSDQGQADFRQGYEDGEKVLAEKTKTQEQIDEFIEDLNPDDVGREELSGYVIRFEGFTDECWQDAKNKKKNITMLEKEILQEWSKEGKLIRWGWKDVGSFGEPDVFFALFDKSVLAEKKEVPVFGLPQDTKKFIEEFGKPIQTAEKPKVIGAPSRQELMEAEQRKRAAEGKKLRGQVTLFGAVSTSRRLGEFEEKPIIPQHPIKSMATEEQKRKLEYAKPALELKLAEESRLLKEQEELRKQLEE